MIKQTIGIKTKKRIFSKKNPFPCKTTNTNHVTTARSKVYDHIITRSFRNSVPNDQRGGQPPVAIILAGPTAAGKSSIVNRFIRNTLGRPPHHFALVSVDFVSELLPEYKKAVDILSFIDDLDESTSIEDYLPSNLEVREHILNNLDSYILTAVTAADDCRNESRDVTRKLLLPAILKEKRDFVYDSTARNVPYYQKLIGELKDMGYQVIVVYVTASLGAIQARAKTRADETGRTVPSDVIKFIFNAMKRKKVFDSLCRLADTCYLYNNQNRPIIAVEKDYDGFLRCHDVRFLGGIVDEKDCDHMYN